MNASNLCNTGIILLLVLVYGTLVKANNEQDLVNSLLESYVSPYGRPIQNVSAPVKVEVRLLLTNIHHVDKEHQTLTASVFLNMMWMDEFMQWDPEDYGGVQQVFLSSDAIWIPDIELLNAYRQPKSLFRRPARAVIQSDGSVNYMPFLKVVVMCPHEGEHEVRCGFQFGSSVYPMSLLAIETMWTKIDLDSYEMSPNWSIIDSSAKLHKYYYDCCPNEQYGSVRFSLILQSKHCNGTSQDDSSITASHRASAIFLAAMLAVGLML